jgi:hypothetical protein
MDFSRTFCGLRGLAPINQYPAHLGSGHEINIGGSRHCDTSTCSCRMRLGGRHCGPTNNRYVTVTAPAVTVIPSAQQTKATTSPLALGETAVTPNGGSVTVYEHRKNVEPQDANQEAIDVKVCVGTKPPEMAADAYPTVGSSPWALYDGQSRRYGPASTMWLHAAAQPGYPFEQRVQWGDCARGWVIIEGQASSAMSRVATAFFLSGARKRPPTRPDRSARLKLEERPRRGADRAEPSETLDQCFLETLYFTPPGVSGESSPNSTRRRSDMSTY